MVARVMFPEVMKGYDMEQVDSYICKLSAAYQDAYDENTLIRERYNSLLEDFKKMSSQEQAEANPEAILIYAEILAQKVIADTQAEAAQTRAEAQKILADTNATAAQMKAEAQRMLNEANAEAAKIVFRARKNMEQAYAVMEQAYVVMEQAVDKMHNMLSVNVPDIKRIMAV
jgi:cell division septum initiation protein DivIVA